MTTMTASAESRRPRASRLTRVRAVGVMAALVAAALLGAAPWTGTRVASAAVSAEDPCPTSAPLKRFSVKAINVDIPLNRRGDDYGRGKMYALAGMLPAIRAQETSRTVSVGLRDDAIQPLVIRANAGDCVEVEFANDAGTGAYGFNIDGLVTGSQSLAPTPAGASHIYRYWIPADASASVRMIRPGDRAAMADGLFGALAVEPAGSVYLHPDTKLPLRSGWEAVIDTPNDSDTGEFREFVNLYHEIGSRHKFGERAMNYRTERFLERLERSDTRGDATCATAPFRDPATPVRRVYHGEPSIVHGIYAGPAASPYSFTRNLSVDETQLPLAPGCHVTEDRVSRVWGFWRVFSAPQQGFPGLPALNLVRLNPLGRSDPLAAIVTAGDATLGIVYLSRPAPATGTVVGLVSRTPSVAELETNVVTIPPGQRFWTFIVRTSSLLSVESTATITAFHPDEIDGRLMFNPDNHRSGNLTVTPAGVRP